MYMINLMLFYGYTCFWFYFLDNPLENFINNSILSYKNLSFEEFKISLRVAFIFFMFNVLLKIRRNYVSFKNFMYKDITTSGGATEGISTKAGDVFSLTKFEEDRYKMDFIIDKHPYSIFIKKSTDYNNLEEIYTDDYKDCITEEVKPFLYFCQDTIHPRDINKIHDRKDKCFIITYKNKSDRTIITDAHIYTELSLEEHEPNENLMRVSSSPVSTDSGAGGTSDMD